MGYLKYTVMLIIVLSLGQCSPCLPMDGFLSSTDDWTWPLMSRSSLTGCASAFADEPPVLYDEFNSSFTGYDPLLWDLETFGNGSVSWVGGEQFNMSAERHSYRALSSKEVFPVGHVVNLRLRSLEKEAVIFIGWTNKTAEGWNYHFLGDSVYFQIALSTGLLDVVNGSSSPQRVLLAGLNPSEYHDYRVVWNNTAVVAYVDGIRLGAIAAPIPDTSLHFKIAITEFRNMTTEGWLCLDRISISPHASMSTENPPFIALNSPGNGTTNLGGDLVDVVVVGSDGFMQYRWDDDPAVEVPVSFEMKLPLSAGTHVLNLSCRDGYALGVTASARFVFLTQGAKPRLYVQMCKTPPAVDGLIREWSSEARFSLSMIRYTGERLDIITYLTYDQEFLYLAVDSPVASGHDSRATVIVDGVCDGHYHGSNRTPMLSLYYHGGSPKAWDGYTELQFLNESESAGVRSFRILPLPSGALCVANEVGSHVQYEFRLPLDELLAGPGSTLGVAFILLPSGMGVDSWFFPMVNPWQNASRLALADLLIPPVDPVFLIAAIMGCGAVAAVVYVGWSRWKLSKMPAILQTEQAERIRMLAQSHDSITIERLSQLASVSPEETTAVVQALVEHGRLKASLDAIAGVIRRR